MGAPPANVGAATIPQSNPGNAKQAMELLSVAQKAVNDALPKIPIGSKVHAKVLKLLGDLGKIVSEAGEEIHANMQTMMQMMSSMKNDGQMRALNQVAPPPNQPPAMMPPGGG
jgi:hypothetical protein